MLIKRIHPAKPGLEKFFGTVEVSVMLALWNGARTVPEIFNQVIRIDNQTLAYTTVLTVVKRLAEKGIIHKSDRYYAPLQASEASFVINVLVDMLKEIDEDFSEELTEALIRYREVE